MRILEAIGLVIMIGIILGIVLTTAWIITIAFRADPDFEDEDEREVYEHRYWEKKKKKT